MTISIGERLKLLGDLDRGTGQVDTAEGIRDHYARLDIDAEEMVAACMNYLTNDGLWRMPRRDAQVALSLAGRMLEIGIDIGRERGFGS